MTMKRQERLKAVGGGGGHWYQALPSLRDSKKVLLLVALLLESICLTRTQLQGCQCALGRDLVPDRGMT